MIHTGWQRSSVQPTIMPINRGVRGGKTVFDESVGLNRIKRPFEELIDYLRLNNPIQDGTVLSTGTGIIVPPELALQEGDEIEMVCEPVGTLRHTMRRTRPRCSQTSSHTLWMPRHRSTTWPTRAAGPTVTTPLTVAAKKVPQTTS